MITINGQAICLEDGSSLAEYLKNKNYHLSRIAVEINGAIIPKSKYDTTILKDNDIVEIVSFVGGG